MDSVQRLFAEKSPGTSLRHTLMVVPFEYFLSNLEGKEASQPSVLFAAFLLDAGLPLM
jgi:hypothetical protein